ncbi:hypothetical protein LCGC14_1808900 [marine sediment metagenome]|uniref:RNA polymerase sigma-70 region 4 domain-containing protein n=1 Tax=marine sediment metagenome TaxID=412755 RepID=A0A0F9HAF4_9ZZZZ
MTGPAPTKRTRMMVEAYKAGGTLREVAAQFGVSMQRVQQVVERHAPEAMRPRGETRFPSVGKPGHELYHQGKCKTCEVSLWGYRPEPRELCGHCEAIAEAAA